MKNTSFFERIMQIVDYYNISNINEFAKEYLGYSSSEKINRLKKEGNNPSYDILLDISNKFENINMNWLVTGNGEMLKNSNEVEINSTAKEPEAKYTTCASCKSKDKLITTLEHKTVRDEEQIERLWKQIEYLTKTRI